MPRRFTAPLAGAAIGLLVLLDLVVVNPTLGAAAGVVLELVILVAAAAALAGALSLFIRHADRLLRQRGDAAGSIALLLGLGVMLLAGLRPGATGADDPAVGWLLAALVFPLIASIFALLFVFTLSAARRTMTLRPREGTVMLGVAAVVLVLLLPVGGDIGELLARASAWTLGVPLGAVFRGLLIATAAVAAVAAAHHLLGFGVADD
jgi:hypothetical protein